MNDQRKLTLVLIATLLIISSLTVLYKIPPAANATYIKGTITQNTDWTLVDSPFIVSNDVTVNAAATLTIEPGVQVRFGGNFSITVYGRIVADGTDDRTILFTSNSLNATEADWNTIIISGTQQSSLTHCTIEYASDGVTLETGTLNLQNNQIRYNTNGTTVNGGTATIQNNQITNNTLNGINIAGGNQVTLHNNIISQNGNGVALTGNLTGNVDITQNNILQNILSGILLGADAYHNTAVTQNNVSQNNYGFLVPTSAGTDITHNYITNNTEGIYYGNGTNHEAHYNDIYDNAIGMDVSPSATADATYNYWGDETGPFHPVLNPNGKGNTVGGNGVNLNFIFFLSAPIDYNNAAPTAVLIADKTVVAPNEAVTFIGTYSTDDRHVDQYFYDFGDGANSGWTTLSLFNHTYSTANKTYTASLTVKDDFNATSQNPATTSISVQDLTPLSVSMDLSSDTADYAGNITVTIHVSNGTSPTQNANVTLFSLKGGTFTPASALTDSNGQLQTTFTAPQVTDTTYVRLIATATQTGTYADGSCHANLKVLPLLHVQIINSPATIKSNATAALTFLVSGGLGQPVVGASVTATADQGTFSTNTDVTDTNGTATLSFTAPTTLNSLTVTIDSTTQTAGYTDGHGQTTITVLQNVLALNITPENTTVLSQGTTNINVQVTCDAAPVPNATVTTSSDNAGNLAPTTTTTDSNGVAAFLFTAPGTTSAINATITATATKSYYVDGAAQTLIKIVPKVLAVRVTADKNPTISETKVTLTVDVTYNLNPVQYANVTVTSQNGGNFSQPTATTGDQGIATFIFTAPQVNQPINITITAQSTTDYADGQNSLTLTVTPGNINVQVTPDSKTTVPGKTVNLTVTATSSSNPLADAEVTITADAGTFTTTTAHTDQNGACTFTYNAPPTQAQLPASIVAHVTKNGYVENTSQTTINVIPGNMSLQVAAYSYEVTAGHSVILTVTATSNGNPLADAEVTITADAGTFTTTTAHTDQNGACTFTYNAPPTAVLVHITANATKNGYFGNTGLTTIKVVPGQQEWPVLTMLLVIIPVIIAVIVAVLIKLKVIIVTAGGDSDAE